MNEFNAECDAECDAECAGLALDGCSRGKEGQIEKRATRKSQKQRGEQKVCMRKPERYLKDCILYEQEDELYWQEDCILYEQEEELCLDGGGGGGDADVGAGGEFYSDSYPWHGTEQDEEWYNQNILSNPRRMTLVRQLMLHTEQPPISPPFVPGIYMSESFGCDDCRRPEIEALVIFPGMKTARWILLSVGCEPQNESTTLKKGHFTCKKLFERVSNHYLDAALLEDYELLLSPEALASYNGIFNEDLSDWLIDYGGCWFHLRVKL